MVVPEPDWDVMRVAKVREARIARVRDGEGMVVMGINAVIGRGRSKEKCGVARGFRLETRRKGYRHR